MTKDFYKLMPEGLRYAPEHDVYGNLEGYIMVLQHNHDGMKQSRDFDRDHNDRLVAENATLKKKVKMAADLLEKYSIDVVEDISFLK